MQTVTKIFLFIVLLVNLFHVNGIKVIKSKYPHGEIQGVHKTLQKLFNPTLSGS